MTGDQRLGRYAVRKRIGAGGFATVWLASDDELASLVAIKVLADNWAGDEHVRERFLEEGRFLRKVASAHVLSVYDVGELEDGRPFLVMGYADQGTLADRLKAGPMAPDEAVSVITQVGRGLTALHRRGVLHRDIKPGNVLFQTTDDGMVAMVADLGLGKALDVSSRLTMIAGSPAYAAPEQARGERLDERADQYSLAAVAYQLLTGRPPYEFGTLHEAAHAVAGSAHAEWRPTGVSGEFDEVLQRALNRDRSQRFDSVGDFTDALTEALRSGSKLEPKDPQPWRAPAESVLEQLGERQGNGDAAATNSGPSLTRAQTLNSGPVGSQPGPSNPDSAATIYYAATPPPAHRNRGVVALLVAACLALGGLIGTVGYRALVGTVTVADGDLSVRVPRAWGAYIQPDGWQPPGQSDRQRALTAGASANWQENGEPGIFAGVMAGTALPTKLPQHPACARNGKPELGTYDEREAVTAVSVGCPGVVVERVIRVATDRLLWIQVQADTPGQADAILATVSTGEMF